MRLTGPRFPIAMERAKQYLDSNGNEVEIHGQSSRRFAHNGEANGRVPRLDDFTVRAEGDLDFRGTLGVSKEAAVGFRCIRVTLELDTQAPQEKLTKLIELTERYRFVLQTLRTGPTVSVSHKNQGGQVHKPIEASTDSPGTGET